PGLETVGGFDDDMPAPNLDGGRIAFVTNRAGTRDVVVWNRATGLATIPALASAGDDIEPSLSADGRWLAFASDRAGGAGGSTVSPYGVCAASPVALPGLTSGQAERTPSVGADGDVIMFQPARSGGGGQFALYRYIRSNAAIDQPASFRDASNDIQP